MFFENELICISSFGINRFSKEKNWELIRFCTKLGFNVVGGFPKLLKYFINTYNPNIIESYIDLRYFDGKGYINSGFNEISITKPNYFYFKENTFELFNRISFQKHKLKDKLEIFDENLTEYENMINNGYLRIFDAGNLKMEKTIK